MPGSDVFPGLCSCTKLPKDDSLFDVKFYPYPTVDDDQIFAAVGGQDVYICRPKVDAEPPFELLRWFKVGRGQGKVSLNSVVWTEDPITKEPLLCVAGESPKHITVLEIDKGEVVRTFPGHGRSINDLAISPLSTDLIASGSEDYTIRLWNMQPKFKEQPCVAMFSGEGHKQPILAIHFHPNGRWLLSGGIDTAICLWSVPSLEELDKTEEELQHHNEPKNVYYPHFRSTEIHHNYVDCLQFYGDLILSRSAKDESKGKANEILLWRITGFNSDDPPPTEPPISSPDQSTRSSFPHSKHSLGFQRLLTFSMPHTSRFYLRFGLLNLPHMRSILCMGNEQSQYYFWDLQSMEEGTDLGEEKKTRKKKGSKLRTAINAENLNKFDDVASESVMSEETGNATPMPSSTSNPAKRESPLSDPFLPNKPHATLTPKTAITSHQHIVSAQMAWSPDGTWLVSVGDHGMMCMFHREKSVVNGANS